MTKAIILCAFVALTACRQASPAEEGEQSIRDAQGMAIMQASARAAAVAPTTIPEASKGGAVQQAPSRIGGALVAAPAQGIR